MDFPTYDEWIETYFEYEWWDFAYENFKETCNNIGIFVKDINFNLGYSQSDYACFSGYIDDWSLFIKSNPSYNFLIDTLCIEQLVNFSWSTTNRRNISCQLSVSEITSYDPDIKDGVCAGMSVSQVLTMVDEANIWSFQEECWIEFVNNLCGDLYKQLRCEYESLSSEESYEEWVKDFGADYEEKKA